MMDYEIIVPSRKRSHNMPTIMALLPTARICVDEREREDYLKVVPEEKILWHPPMDGFFNVYNWAIEQVKTPCYVSIGDDFVGVRVTTGSGRFITDPEEILAIIENSIQATEDLGLTTFCYTRTANSAMLKSEMMPIRPVQPVCNAFGVMREARYRKYDTKYLGRGDVDWTLRTLLEDRCVYADVRYYFDCGAVFGGRGGNVGLVTPEIFRRSSELLKEKWGASISYRALPFQKKRQVAAMSIAVSRRNKTAQK